MNDEERSIQRFRRYLYKYVNGDFLSLTDSLIGLVSQQYPFVRRAKKICTQYDRLVLPVTEERTLTRVTVEAYGGNNSHVHQMMNLVRELKDDILGAYVHGSLGTYEEVAFSDFDALVIIKEEVFNTPERLARLALKLNSGQSIMFSFDPLQHHGWFVLTAADMRRYPEDYFPIELFSHAKSLMTDQGLELCVWSQESKQDARQSFNNLARSVKTLIHRNESCKNLYFLKILLSQFMLLPALYIEIRNGRGIYKKTSFEAARADFDEKDWAVMDEISSIRESWCYEKNHLWMWVMTRPNKNLRAIARNHAPGIPKELRLRLTDDFFRRMTCLVDLMQEKVNEINI